MKRSKQLPASYLNDSRTEIRGSNFTAQTTERDSGIKNPLTGDMEWVTTEYGVCDGVQNDLRGLNPVRVYAWRMSAQIDGMTYSAISGTRQGAYEGLARELQARLIDGCPF